MFGLHMATNIRVLVGHKEKEYNSEEESLKGVC